MKYEFHAEYHLHTRPRHIQQGAIDFLTTKANRAPEEWAELAAVQDLIAKRQLMAQTQTPPAPYKDYARVGTRGEKGGLLQAICDDVWEQFLKKRMLLLRDLALVTPLAGSLSVDLSGFPRGTSVIHYMFRLERPYISRDDAAWDVWDNPVKKEWVFKVPYVAPSQWKGALRAALMQNLADDLHAGNLDERAFLEERLRLYRLFGNEKNGTAGFLNRVWTLHRVGPRPEEQTQMMRWEEEYRQALDEVAKEFEQTLREKKYRTGDIEGFQGCLHFYPTFFDKIDLEVINPHPRDTGAGKQPIYFESVPAGAKGTFTLLYVPFDLIGQDETTLKKQALDDLQLLAKGLQAMFTVYGFGAKTNSGYGVAEDTVENGTLTLNLQDIVIPQAETPQVQEPDEAYLKYLDASGKVRSVFEGGGEGELMSNKEYRNKEDQHGGGSLSEFKRFRSWYIMHGEQWRTYLQSASAETDYFSNGFDSLSQLVEMCENLEEKPEVAGGDK